MKVNLTGYRVIRELVVLESFWAVGIDRIFGLLLGDVGLFLVV